MQKNSPTYVEVGNVSLREDCRPRREEFDLSGLVDLIFIGNVRKRTDQPGTIDLSSTLGKSGRRYDEYEVILHLPSEPESYIRLIDVKTILESELVISEESLRLYAEQTGREDIPKQLEELASNQGKLQSAANKNVATMISSNVPESHAERVQKMVAVAIANGVSEVVIEKVSKTGGDMKSGKPFTPVNRFMDDILKDYRTQNKCESEDFNLLMTFVSPGMELKHPKLGYKVLAIDKDNVTFKIKRSEKVISINKLKTIWEDRKKRNPFKPE